MKDRVLWVGRGSPTFRKNILPNYSRPKSKQNMKPAVAGGSSLGLFFDCEQGDNIYLRNLQLSPKYKGGYNPEFINYTGLCNTKINKYTCSYIKTSNCRQILTNGNTVACLQLYCVYNCSVPETHKLFAVSITQLSHPNRGVIL